MHSVPSLSTTYLMPIEFNVKPLTFIWIQWAKSDYLLLTL